MGDDRQALTLQRVYGISDVPCNLVNLADEHNDRVAYLAAHTAIIYNKQTDTQTFLQGHCNAISCMQASVDRSMLVTADHGSHTSLLVFWDPASGQPMSIVQQPHAAGVLSLALSADGQQLATLSPPHQTGNEATQEVSIWDISAVAISREQHPAQLRPLSTATVLAEDPQTHIAYHPADSTELITTSSSRVSFWQQQQQQQLPHEEGAEHGHKQEQQQSHQQVQLSAYSPPFKATEFQQSVGSFIVSAFVPNTTQAVTSTTDGDVVIWEQDGLPGRGAGQRARRALKIIRLHGAAINHLGTIGDFLVTGGADGLIRLFDSGMRLCAWFEDLNAGPVTSVSFATKGQQEPKATMRLSSLAAPNFMVTTKSGKLLAVQSDTFNMPDPDNPSGSEMVVAAPDSCLTQVLAHPLRPELLLLASPDNGTANDNGNTDASKDRSRCKQASLSGGRQQGSTEQQVLQPQSLMRWDMTTQSCVVVTQLPHSQHALQLMLARDGSFVVVGCAGGHLAILKGDSLHEVVALRHTKHDITRLSVSADGCFIACADACGSALLYGFLPHKGTYHKWDLVGKFKAHQGDTVGLQFGEAPGGQTRLFSLGSDQRLVEYDVSRCTAANVGLRALSIRECVPPGSSGRPCALCFAPPMPYYSHSSTETLLLVADDAYKIKAFNPDAESPLAAATYLGPTFGDPINKLLPFRSVSDGGVTPWLAYSTPERVVGLIKWPLDCDPGSRMGLIAHPGPVHGLVLSFDGRKLITLGTSGIMNVWDVNTEVLLPKHSQPSLATAVVPSADKPDWPQLLGDEALYEELKDYFCYAQLTTQPLDTTEGFGLDGRVPSAALPDLMRAAGHYPSEADSSSLMAHVRFLADMAPADDSTVCSSSGGFSSSGGGRETEATDGKQRDSRAAPRVDLDKFLLLYLSHRPFVGFSRQQVEDAFRTLGASTAAGVLSSERLLEMLQTDGERMTAEELQQVLQALTGLETPEEALSDYISAHGFMTEILGFAA